MPKYLVTLQSGRDFIMEHNGECIEEVAWDSYDEACLMDDYLVDVEQIDA